MRTRIAKAFITLIALITFVAIADRMVWGCMTWECNCIHAECDECTNDECNDEPDAESDIEDKCICDECCHAQAVQEYADEFTALFNSYTYKLAKNGRSMVNGKFVAMPKGSK